MTELVEKLREHTAKLTKRNIEETFEITVLMLLFITSVLAIAPIV